VDAPNTGILANQANQSMAVGWVDFNGDGYPDLWIGRHDDASKQAPELYINQGNGTFQDAFAQVFPGNILTDAHGSQWADVFNDGSPDFLQTVGALGGKSVTGSLFYVNRNGQLTQEATADGLTNGLGAGRSPLFLDWNHDGLLDALFLNHSRRVSSGPTGLYEQTPTGFVNVTAQAGISTDLANNLWAQSVDLTGDGIPDLVIEQVNKGPLFYEATRDSPGYKFVPHALPNDLNITDMAVGDFFNTGQNEIFLTAQNANVSDVAQSGNNIIAAQLVQGGQTGFTFQTTGKITWDFNQPFDVSTNGRSQHVYIGSGGYHPASFPFTLDPANPSDQGIMAHDPSNGDGFYVGYDPTNRVWQVYYADPAIGQQPFILTSSAPVSNLTRIGFSAGQMAERPYFLAWNPATKTFVDETAQAGLATPLPATNVVAGDFNNDGYLDLYVSSETAVSDQGGILYLNNGNGTFTAQQVEAPYPGVLSQIHGFPGRKAITADFNRDGTLDLFLSSTNFETPSTIYPDAPNELLLNPPNGNNWLEMNLHGVESNRDAIGAVVYISAGGVTQRRDVTGGKHWGGQNSDTVHFGLGKNTTAATVTIDWPSGIVQTLTNVTADQILNIVEPGGHSMAQARPITVFSPNLTYPGSLDGVNSQDYYRFTLTGPGLVQLTLNGQPAQAQLLDQNGNVMAQSVGSNGTQTLTASVSPGTYYAKAYINPQGPGTPYALTFDVTPAIPIVSNLTVTPLLAAAAPVTVVATASTVNRGNAVVGGAEFFIDTAGPSGTGTAMAAHDGTFDESTEAIVGTIDATLYGQLSVGNHRMLVHARDAQGNWGPFVSLMFKKDDLGPLTLSLSVTPDPSSSPPTIRAEVSDKPTGLSRVTKAVYFIDTPGPAGTGRRMQATTQLHSYRIRFYDAVIPARVYNQLSAGQHTVYVRGEDQAGNWGPLASVTFTKVVGADLALPPVGDVLGGTVAARRSDGDPATADGPATTSPQPASPGVIERPPQTGMAAGSGGEARPNATAPSARGLRKRPEQFPVDLRRRDEDGEGPGGP
jgi:hypothetical protein